MAAFENPKMKVVEVGEEVPIKLTTEVTRQKLEDLIAENMNTKDYTKLTFEGIGQKLEDLIAEKLNAHETGEHILTCAEIHDLASSYAELSKVGWPFDWRKFSYNEHPMEEKCNASAQPNQ